MSDELSTLDSIPDVSFIDNKTLEDVKSELIKGFEEGYRKETGQLITLAKADPNRIILNACALLIYQGYQFIDRAGKQNLLKYAYSEFLENLGVLRGVTRNAASPALVTLRFALSEVRSSPVLIPNGTRVTCGYDVFFATKESTEIPSGKASVDIQAECSAEGDIGNGFLPGEVKTLVDSVPYIKEVWNIDTSDGGADVETDASLAERIYLAPAGYSVAGPEDAYVYWVKTYNTSIGDVKVTSPSPAVVNIRFIKKNGDLPDASLIQGLQDFMEDSNIRPLTDQVVVAAPETVEYEIALTYYINYSDRNKAVAIQNSVSIAIEEYTTWQCSKIGRDINPSELCKCVVAAGAKRVTLTQPCEPVIVPETSVAKLKSISVLYGGIEDD